MMNDIETKKLVFQFYVDFLNSVNSKLRPRNSSKETFIGIKYIPENKDYSIKEMEEFLKQNLYEQEY